MSQEQHDQEDWYSKIRWQNAGVNAKIITENLLNVPPQLKEQNDLVRGITCPYQVAAIFGESLLTVSYPNLPDYAKVGIHDKHALFNNTSKYKKYLKTAISVLQRTSGETANEEAHPPERAPSITVGSSTPAKQTSDDKIEKVLDLLATHAKQSVDVQQGNSQFQKQIQAGLLATDGKADRAQNTADNAYEKAIGAHIRLDYLIASGTLTPIRRLTYHDIIETKPSAGTVVPAQVVDTDTEQGKRSCNFFLFHLAIIQPACQLNTLTASFPLYLHLYIMILTQMMCQNQSWISWIVLPIMLHQLRVVSTISFFWFVCANCTPTNCFRFCFLSVYTMCKQEMTMRRLTLSFPRNTLQRPSRSLPRLNGPTF